jgi:TetR/AcrR family tetracycline transcriptional repressor
VADADPLAPGRRLPLTRERIVAAALTVVDREGLPALNMRRLGAELRVEAMAVYKHFPNKRAVLDEIVVYVFRELDETVQEVDWRAGFRATFLTLRSLLSAHPNALPLVASRPLASRQLTRRLESTRDLLLRSALPEDEVLHLLHAGLSLTLGYLWLEAGGFVGELPYSAPFLRTRSEDVSPTRVDVELSLLRPTWSHEEDFSAALELLLAEPGKPRPSI